MKKICKHILPLCLCLILTFANITDMAVSAYSASPVVSVSENDADTEDFGSTNPTDEEITTENTEDVNQPDSSLPDCDSLTTENVSDLQAESAAVGSTTTATFYNSDGTTILFQLPVVITSSSTKLCDQYPDSAFLTPVRNGYKLKSWNCITTGKSYYPVSLYTKCSFNQDLTFVASWYSSPYQYRINYNLNGGKFDPSSEDDEIATFFTVETEKDIVLHNPVKKGYLFDGWYKESEFINLTNSIPAHSYFDFDYQENNDYEYNLYAKWTALQVENTSIQSLTNPSSGKAIIKLSESKEAEGYEIQFSRDSKFKKNVHKKDIKNQTSYTVTNLPKGKTYYFRARAYKHDSTNTKYYIDYSDTKSIKIKKGVNEYVAKSNSGKLNSVTIAQQTDLSVKATVTKRLKSSDDFYYLVTIDPVTGKVLKKIDETDKSKKLEFQLPVRDDNGISYIQSKFAIAIKKGKNYMLISNASFVQNPEAAAFYTESFPVTTSKKGLQGSLDSSIGVQHSFINIDLNNILNGSTPYKYNGKTYYFNDAYGSTISAANSSNITMTGQIMMTWSDTKKYMILKSARSSGHVYYTINAQEKKAREELEAAFAFMAERYSTKDCHLDNWILGNEVNIHKVWYYAGNISNEEFMKNYADTYRILYYAVRSSSKNSRVFICTDHTWINRCGDWGAKPFMDSFNKQIKAQNKNIQWNLAYHAYPAILTSAATWNDSHTSNNSDSEFVTPKNLNVLTDYVKKNFGSKTHILLSEQGFTSNSGQNVQAAAIAYTYYKAEFNNMIDAVIFRSYEDAPSEVAQGLSFGLLTGTGAKKQAYNVYKYMDTPSYDKYTKGCLSTLGRSSWSDVIPGFSDKKLKNKPSR